MQKQSPMLRLWELGSKEHGGLIRAILSAVAGVLAGMAPYFAAAQIVIALIHGERSWPFYLRWCGVALAGYILRTCLYTLALSMSHRATFSILKSIRERILDKLPNMPLGTVVDISSGKMKQIIVDQVESMETPLAHLLPEMTSNILGPVCILFTCWRWTGGWHCWRWSPFRWDGCCIAAAVFRWTRLSPQLFCLSELPGRCWLP